MADPIPPAATGAELAKVAAPAARPPARESDTAFISVFQNEQSFEAAQRMASALCSSDIIPITYQGQAKKGNCLIALEISQRLRQSVLVVMQNLNIIHGRPSWAASYVIGGLNACGRFTPLEFEWQGEEGKDDWGCRAACQVKSSGVRIRGTLITIGMAKAEGWYGKNGSKWKTMPEQMLQYRAGSFFAKIHAPEILNGMQTREELEDGAVEVETSPVVDRPALPEGSGKVVEEPTKTNAKKTTEKPAKGVKAAAADIKEAEGVPEKEKPKETPAPAKEVAPEPEKPAETPAPEPEKPKTEAAPPEDDMFQDDPPAETSAPAAELKSKAVTVVGIGTGRKGSNKELVYVLDMKGAFIGKAYVEKEVYGTEDSPKIPRVDEQIYVEVESVPKGDKTLHFVRRWEAAAF